MFVLAGAVFWLFDEFLAERADIERQVENAPFPDYVGDGSDRNERRRSYEKTASGVGKVLILAGILLLALWGAPKLF